MSLTQFIPVYQDLDLFEQESYHQYERVTGNILSKLPNGDINTKIVKIHDNNVDAFRHACLCQWQIHSKIRSRFCQCFRNCQ